MTSCQTSNLKIKKLTISNRYQKRRMMQSDSIARIALKQGSDMMRDGLDTKKVGSLEMKTHRLVLDAIGMTQKDSIN